LHLTSLAAFCHETFTFGLHLTVSLKSVFDDCFLLSIMSQPPASSVRALILAIIDEKIQGTGWQEMKRKDQESAIAEVINETFPNLIKKHKQIGDRVRTICGMYGNRGAKNATVFKEGSRCIIVERMPQVERQLLSQFRRERRVSRSPTAEVSFPTLPGGESPLHGHEETEEGAATVTQEKPAMQHAPATRETPVLEEVPTTKRALSTEDASLQAPPSKRAKEVVPSTLAAALDRIKSLETWRAELERSNEHFQHKQLMEHKSTRERVDTYQKSLISALRKDATGAHVLNLADMRTELSKSGEMYSISARISMPRPHPGYSRGEVHEDLRAIQSYMKEIVDSVPKFRDFGVLDLTDSLKTLLEGTGNAIVGISIQEVREIYGDANFVRFLLNAAMCQWVLESDFPFIEGDNSRMLSEYRNVLSGLKGVSMR
jgi:hypothetical protein